MSFDLIVKNATLPDGTTGIDIALNVTFTWSASPNADSYTLEVGYYSDSWNGDVDIKSQKDLENYIKMIACMVALNGA